MASTADFRNGMVLQIDGDLWAIAYFQHVKPGKGGAFVRTKLKNVLSGAVVENHTRRDRRQVRVPPERLTSCRVGEMDFDDGEVETLARDLAGSGDVEHEVDTPFAWAEEVSEDHGSEPGGPTIGRFFDDLLSYGEASEPEES